jgi:DNA-binding transcriptional MerR regulator
MKIKKVSEITGLSSHTLRFYEKTGLIPCISKNRSGHRNYSESDLELISFIQKWKLTGMPISEISRYMELMDREEEIYGERMAILVNHRDRIKEKIKSFGEFLEIIEFKIRWYKKNGGNAKASE